MRSNCFNKKAARHQLVHELRAKGLTYREIAERVGIKQVTVWKYLTTPEPIISPRRALSLERQAIARKMKAEGATYREIGNHFGMTASSALEMVRDGEPIAITGTCSVCGVYGDDLVLHHTDYINDKGQPVCRKCHVKVFHPESLNRAKAANADKRVDDKIAILTFSGWTDLKVSIRDNGRRHITGRPPHYHKSIDAPNPLKDLNALHEAEDKLSMEQSAVYEKLLEEIINRDFISGETIFVDCIWHATANHKSEAILKVIRNQVDAPPNQQ